VQAGQQTVSVIDLDSRFDQRFQVVLSGCDSCAARIGCVVPVTIESGSKNGIQASEPLDERVWTGLLVRKYRARDTSQ